MVVYSEKFVIQKSYLTFSTIRFCGRLNIQDVFKRCEPEYEIKVLLNGREYKVDERSAFRKFCQYHN